MIGIAVESLGEVPPFDRLGPEELVELGRAASIRFVAAGDSIFLEGEDRGSRFFVVRRGSIELSRKVDGQATIVDRCQEGDLFGLRAHMVEAPYSASARALEDSLVWAIRFDVFRGFMEHHPEIPLHFAAGFAAELPRLRGRVFEVAESHRSELGSRDITAQDLRPIRFARDLVACDPGFTVREATRRMVDERVGSIIAVDTGGCPVGIMTNSDVCQRVVGAGLDPDSTPLEEVMSTPVFTVESGLTVDDLVEEIVRGRLRHFVVTEDGTSASPAIGVISEHDVLKAKGTVPTALIDELHRSRTSEQLRHWRDRAEELLRQYIREEVRMRLVCVVMAKINDALIETALRIASSQLAVQGCMPASNFCWLALGSEGREEQLLRTDQDNALLFESVPNRSDEEVRSELVELGSRVVDILVESGFARCPGGIMASNPRWVLSEAEWRSQFDRWISKPEPKELMYANIFFDLRPVAGVSELAGRLKRWVVDRAHQEPGFFAFFAQSALANPPPLSFFKNMLLEKTGDHKDQFDIKARAMMPLCDAARVLTYHEGIEDPVNTAERLRRLADISSGSLARLCSEAAPAYEMFMRFRVREGLDMSSSGRYLRMEHLTRLEQKALRNGFSVIEDMQLALRSRFRADFLR